MNKRIRIAVPVLVTAALGTWYVTRPEPSSERPLFASGTVEATTADLGFQIPGRIQDVSVSEGDRVVEAQELARLDQREAEAVRAAARAQLDAAEARLAEMERGARPQEIAAGEAALRSAAERAANARRELDRTRTLHEGGAISRQALDQAETALEVADASRVQAEQSLGLLNEGTRAETLRAQRARVEQARANLERTLVGLQHAGLWAPFPGLVTITHRKAGEIVQPGAPVVTLLDPDDRWVRIYVREDQIGRVRIGMDAEIVSDSYPDRVYAGEVVFVGSEAEFTPRNVQTQEERIKLVYPVKVRILDDDGFELKPGVPADVTLVEADG